MADSCKSGLTTFEIYVLIVSVIASSLTVFQNIGVLSVGQESVLTSSGDPITIILAGLLFFVSFLFFSRSKR